jgi:hypothetical protein
VLGGITGINFGTDTKVGIGTTIPGALLDVQRDGSAIPETARFSTFGTHNEILFRSAGGTRAGPTATPASRILMQLGATGHAGGTDFVTTPRAAIQVFANEPWTASAQGTNMRFLTTANGTTQLSMRMIINDDGNIGIGTPGPLGKLQVVTADDTNPSIISAWDNRHFVIGASANSGGIGFSYDQTNDVGYIEALSPGAAWRNLVLQVGGGNIGIGTTSPADKLDVNGDLRVGTGTTGCVKDSDGTVIAGACSSDARLKRDITPFPRLLDKLVRLQPVHFYWRSEEFKGRHFGVKPSFGLIAQEVEKVLPELVSEDEQGYKAVNYSKLPLLSLQAIKELKAENNTLRHQFAEQQNEIVTLKSKVAQIEALTRVVCQAMPNADLCKP